MASLILNIESPIVVLCMSKQYDKLIINSQLSTHKMISTISIGEQNVIKNRDTNNEGQNKETFNLFELYENAFPNGISNYSEFINSDFYSTHIKQYCPGY